MPLNVSSCAQKKKFVPLITIHTAGLPLLPLLDGTIKTIEKMTSGQHVYMSSSLERNLLGAQAALLLDAEAVSSETAHRCGVNPEPGYEVVATLLCDGVVSDKTSCMGRAGSEQWHAPVVSTCSL